MNDVDRTRYLLTEAENEQIFRSRIVRTALDGTRQDRPVVVFVAGQTGAGKTSVTELATTALARRGTPVNINLDTYKPQHPRYDQLVAEDDLTAGAYTSIDGHKWMEKAEAYAIEQRFDVVMESAMRDPRDFEEPARRFRAAGYQVEVLIVAVHESQSRLGALDRYVQQQNEFGSGRFIDPQIHDACYDGVLRASDAIDDERLADRVFVVRRDAQVVYSNQLGPDGQWQRPAGTAEAVAAERNRPWSPQETHQHLNSVRRVRSGAAELGDSAAKQSVAAEAKTIEALARPLLDKDVMTVRLADAGVAPVRAGPPVGGVVAKAAVRVTGTEKGTRAHGVE
ncbi:zeta toxin family protein [Kribbella sp. NPDC051620]|uniref:zeta toxin family protein n=1 Tax=Kribbella sp. NPDC051620 TaxID=3364120 RepID=UPI0037BA35C3